MKLILGPPGTGKTTELLRIVEQELQNGIPPERIAFCSHTKSAAWEARDRAVKKFSLDSRRFKYFKTLHSIAFTAIGVLREQVMDTAHYRRVGQSISMDLTGDYLDNGSQDALVKFIEEQSRARRLPLLDTAMAIDPSADPRILRRYQTALADYKAEYMLYDYTDMINGYVERGEPLDVDVFIVDEAQDLSRSQWEMLNKASKKAKRVYVAGDDDQAVHVWGGADVETFLSLEGAERQVLDVSYRLPESIYDFANDIVNRIVKRFPKEWRPRPEAQGQISAVNANHLGSLDYSQGSWLLLARNSRFLGYYTEALKEAGYLFYGSNRGEPYLATYFDPVMAWEKLRGGRGTINAEVTKQLLKYLDVSRNPKAVKGDYDRERLSKEYGVTCFDLPWFDAMVGIPLGHRVYLQRCYRNGERFGNIRIRLSTIHGAKGGEADNVVLIPDMSWPTYNEYSKNPDNEHRVFYVGVTRARERLYLTTPFTGRYYAF